MKLKIKFRNTLGKVSGIIIGLFLLILPFLMGYLIWITLNPSNFLENMVTAIFLLLVLFPIGLLFWVIAIAILTTLDLTERKYKRR